jgi:hypothetical protein
VERGFGARDSDTTFMPIILEAIKAVREAYKRFTRKSGASSLLVTKVMLGTFGCLPACARYFIAGWKHFGFSSSDLNCEFVQQTFDFCQAHRVEFREEQAQVECRMRYPLMKLVDMHFYQTGFAL